MSGKGEVVDTDSHRLRWKRLAILTTLGPMVLLAIVLSAAKWVVEAQAQSKARGIVGSIEQSHDDVDAISMRLTALVHQALQKTSSSTHIPLLMRLRPYLSHRFLPAPLRIDSGAIDTLYLEGLCDNAARALLYILNQTGFSAAQLNIVTPAAAHSAVVAEAPRGRRLLLDPFFGVVPVGNGNILSPEQAQKRVRNEKRPGDIWRRLAPSAKPDFYVQFAQARFARQGSRLDIEGSVVLSPGEIAFLGKPDGASEDVSVAAANAGLSPYWHYIGSRYDRAWVRSLHFLQATRMTIVLIERPNARLFTTERPAEVSGRKLVYEVKAGETLRFVDGKAGFDWLRLRSYQDIDYITIESMRNPE